MSIETLKAALPEYAKDLKLNLDSLSKDTTLTPVQKAGTFIACALACQQPQVIQSLLAEFGSGLTPEQLTAAKGAAAIMAMNNIYYRFVHLVEKADYKTLPAKLRMNFIGNPGVPKEEFELWCLAVSAINGCGMCIASHENILRQHGLSSEQIQTSVRIASTVHAVSAVLAAESAQTQALSSEAA